MQLADAHNHLDDPALDEVREGLVAQARAAGVHAWMIGGTTPDTWSRTERIAAETGGVAALGLHPWFVAPDLDLEATMQALTARAPAAIGELGLDRLRATSETQWALQRQAFRAQLAVARDLDRPIVVHCVRAYGAVLDVLAADGVPAAGGLVHAWSGAPELVPRAVKLGLHLSFGPLVCREHAKRARASAAVVPAERLLVETDAPDQAIPGASRGAPDQVRTVLQAVAKLRNQPVETMAAHTWRNFHALVGHP